MELRQLRYLVAIAEEGHITRAAARSRVAQPALSQQLRRLEDELGIVLVDRTTRHVTLTAAGALLVARARRVLADLDAARAEIDELTGLIGGRLQIGVTRTPGPLELPALLAGFHRERPGVELVVREELSTALAAQLREDALELAFVTLLDEPERAGLELRPLASEPLVAVVSREHRLGRRRWLRVADLRDQPLVAFPPGATIRGAVRRAALAAGFEPRVAFEAGEVQRARALVAEGLAVAVLPRSDAIAPGPPVTVVPFAGTPLVHRVSLAWRLGRRHAPAARAMIEAALDGHTS